MKANDIDKSIVVTQNVTSTRLVTSAFTFPSRTRTSHGLEQVTEKSVDKLTLKSKNKYLDMAETKKDIPENTGGTITRQSAISTTLMIYLRELEQEFEKVNPEFFFSFQFRPFLHHLHQYLVWWKAQKFPTSNSSSFLVST